MPRENKISFTIWCGTNRLICWLTAGLSRSSDFSWSRSWHVISDPSNYIQFHNLCIHCLRKRFHVLSECLAAHKSGAWSKPIWEKPSFNYLHLPAVKQEWKILKIFSDISDESSKRNRNYDEFIKLKIYSASYNVEPEDPALLNVQY